MKNITLLFSVFLIICLTSSCSDESDSDQLKDRPIVTIRNLNDKGVLPIEKGTTVKLELEVSPSTALNQLVFEGEYTDIFSVDDTGLIAGLNEGDGLLTIKSGKDLSILTACKINVFTVFKYIEQIVFPETKDGVLEVSPKGTTQVVIGTLPTDASNKSFSFESSDPTKFTVDKTGAITPVTPGSIATLKVTALDGSEVTAECEVRVLNVMVEEMVTTNMSTLVGKKLDLSELVIVYPENATQKSVSFLSNDLEIATIDENGMLTAIAQGEVDITVKTMDGSEVESTLKIAVGQNYTVLDRSTYGVTCSDEKESDGGGRYMILNDDNSKYWHSEWSPNAPLPHWLLVDMKEVKKLSRILIGRRVDGHTTDTKFVRIEGSANNTTYKTLGVIDFGNSSNVEASIEFYPTDIRYVKITIEESNRAPFANLCLFKPYVLE